MPNGFYVFVVIFRNDSVWLKERAILQVITDLELFNFLNAKLNPICCLLALLGAHPILYVSRVRVKCGISRFFCGVFPNFQGEMPPPPLLKGVKNTATEWCKGKVNNVGHLYFFVVLALLLRLELIKTFLNTRKKFELKISELTS
jgi:hypothetical protein